MELGKKIRQLRFKAGLTQEQLGEQLGIGAQSVSKWENGVSMPDITALPLLAEIFGISIDDLFDLTAEQRFNRIENRMDMEDELPQDVFWECEEFLKGKAASDEYKQRATDLLAYLYWHRMETYARKAARSAKESVRMAPGVKNNQWILIKAAGHACWDWNLNNHADAVDFWREMVQAAPEERLPYMYLVDNLLADHRADEAEEAVGRFSRLKDANPVMVEAYRANIALARFDEPAADRIISEMLEKHPDDSAALFEAAQYYAGKGDYDRTIEMYERSFEKETRRPRFTDELMAIADIYQIRKDYRKAAETYDRIIDLLQNEWGMTEDTVLKDAQEKKARLLELAR